MLDRHRWPVFDQEPLRGCVIRDWRNNDLHKLLEQLLSRTHLYVNPRVSIHLPPCLSKPVRGTIFLRRVSNSLFFLPFLSYAVSSITPADCQVTRSLVNCRPHVCEPKTIVMGRGVYGIYAMIIGQLNSRMVNASAWDWGTRSAWFWLASCLVCTAWTFFKLPETGGFSFGELEVLCANKVSARKFSKVVVHGEGHTLTVVSEDTLSNMLLRPRASGDWTGRSGHRHQDGRHPCAHRIRRAGSRTVLGRQGNRNPTSRYICGSPS